jgi:hypothetical protein
MDTTESRSFAAHLADLLRNEQHAMADFLVVLAEFDRTRRWIELGYSGLFAFLHRELKLSKAASFSRMTAAGLIQRFPEIVSPLRGGRLCLSTMGSLAKVFTPGNCAEVLPRFFHLSGLEAKTIAAELAPVPDPPTRTVVTVTPIRVPQGRRRSLLRARVANHFASKVLAQPSRRLRPALRQRRRPARSRSSRSPQTSPVST